MTMRVLIAGFKHETNAFCKLPTDLASYRTRGLYYGDEMRSALSGTNTVFGEDHRGVDDAGFA